MTDSMTYYLIYNRYCDPSTEETDEIKEIFKHLDVRQASPVGFTVIGYFYDIHQAWSKVSSHWCLNYDSEFISDHLGR